MNPDVCFIITNYLPLLFFNSEKDNPGGVMGYTEKSSFPGVTLFENGNFETAYLRLA